MRLIDRRMYADAQRVAGSVGLDCSPRAVVGDLTVGQQQLVEIARALCMRSRVLIMDEPTSSLTERETERLFEVIRNLKRDGVGVLYISHRLKEVELLADRVVVLRDGRNSGELLRGEVSHDSLVRLMVGRQLDQFFQRAHQPAVGDEETAPPVFEARGLRYEGGRGEPVSFVLRPGEVVGMAGLMGAGRTELAEAVFGVRRLLAGQLFVKGLAVTIRSPADAVRAGVYLAPEDRRNEGLVLADNVRRNIGLGSLDRFNYWGLVAAGRERETARSMCQKLHVRTPSVEQTVGLLSGGNQQKVVLAKWLCREPRVLFLDEPTRGIDVGAKAEIYSLIDELAAQGVGVLMISSDLEEILGVCDRTLVMHEGSLAGELGREQMSEQAIMNLATGGHLRP